MEPLLYQPPATQFSELRLELRETSQGNARVTVVLPGNSGRTEEVEIPLAELARESEIDATGGLAILRGTSSDPTLLQRDVGRRLFLTLFGGRLKRYYRQAVETAASSRQPLAVVIATDSPRLQAQPWELLVDSSPRRSNEFLALGGWPIVRSQVDIPLSVERAGSSALRVLVITADIPFPVVRDARLIRKACSTDALHVDEARVATAAEAVEAIAHSGADIVHYAGMAAMAAAAPVRIAATALMDGAALVTALRGLPSVRLVVLNGSATSETAAEVAPWVPSVVGMRGQMKGEACAEFAAGLYTALASGQSVRAAVCAGRQQVRYRYPQDRHWSLPVHWDRGDAVLLSFGAASESSACPVVDGPEGEDVLAMREMRAVAQRNLDAITKLSDAHQFVPESMKQQRKELLATIEQLDAELPGRLP